MLGFLFGNYSSMYGGPLGPSQPAPVPTTTNMIGTGQFQALQQRVDSLELACAGLWNLLKQTHGLTDEQLRAMIQQVDAADGAPDGKITRQGGECPHCHHRILSRTATKCLWCGAPLVSGPFNQSAVES